MLANLNSFKVDVLNDNLWHMQYEAGTTTRAPAIKDAAVAFAVFAVFELIGCWKR